MTREHKLALIIGFTLILIVGVLVSDHLSGQRELKLASVAVDDERSTLGLGEAISPVLRWAEQNAREIAPAARIEPSPAAADPQQIAQTQTVQPEPVVAEPTFMVIEQGLQQPSRNNLEQAIRRAGTPTDSGAQRSTPANPEARVADRATPAVDPKDIQIYRIKEKDSLYSIARATYGDANLWKALAAFNEGRVGADGTVRVGATIKLPPKHVLTGEQPTSAQTRAPETKPEPKAAPKPTTAPATANVGTTHKVAKGDSLSKLAERYLGSKARADEILAANRDKISDPNQIKIDMVLRIPPK
ncbi:MAG: LysM peptidoglycan-binding domain-containing protein [Phycisphaeraceae bacterium]|nr:MAG: LysM peptidoglycan-binding domain-containing protein [Phycisphaeraceae bacterium]